MENRFLKIFMGEVFVWLILSGCGVEPKEDPSDMELLVGKYPRAHTTYNDIDIEQIDDSTNLILNSDYTYSLLFKGKMPNRDYIFTVEQNGFFELSKTRYDRNCGDALCFPFLEGIITFKSDSGAKWSSEFHYSQINKVLALYPNGKTLLSQNGFGLKFYHWEK